MVKTRVSQEGVYVLRTLVGDPENTHGTAWGTHGPLVGIDSNIWGQQSAVTFQDSVWYVSCKSERDHYTQVHCMYVCVCTNMIYILLSIWTFSCTLFCADLHNKRSNIIVYLVFLWQIFIHQNIKTTHIWSILLPLYLCVKLIIIFLAYITLV